MEQSTIAYTAGIIDGEGSIQINPTRNKKGGRCYWSLTVQISSNCLDMLCNLQSEWGLGNVTFWKSRGAKKGRKSGNWRIYSGQAKELLKLVLPYLRIKKEHAEVAMQFIKYVGFKKGKLTAEVSEIRTKLALQMRKLNERYGKGQLKELKKEVA